MTLTLADAWYDRDPIAAFNHYADNLIETEARLIYTDSDFDERPYNLHSVTADGNYAHPHDELF